LTVQTNLLAAAAYDYQIVAQTDDCHNLGT
jgi:hypothetical protein